MKNNIFKVIILSLFVFSNSLYAEILTINQAYNLALKNSNMMKSSAFELEAKKEAVEQVKADLYPQINSSASRNKSYFEINDLTSFGEKKYTEESTDYMISLNQSIYNPQIYAKLDVEKIRLKLYEIATDIEKQELASTVLKSYLDILKSKNRILLLASDVQYNKSLLESFEKRFAINLSNKMDLLQARIEYSTSQLELKKEESLFKVYKVKLMNLIGTKDIEFPVLGASMLDLNVIQNIYDRVSNQTNFESNLEILQSKYMVEMSKLDVKSSQSGHYPKLSFDARYTKYDAVAGDDNTDYENTKKLTLSLNLPLYQGGYVSSKVQASKLNLKASNADYLETQDELQSRYDEILAVFGASMDSVNLYKEHLSSTKLYLESIELGYESGLKSIIDLQDAQNKVHEIEYKYLENMYDMLDAYIELLKITNHFEGLQLIDDLIN